jgi:hypothetical protein
MKAKEYLRDFKKKHGISDMWEQHELLKLMNEYDSTAVIKKNDLSHIVSVSVCRHPNWAQSFDGARNKPLCSICGKHIL